MKKFFALLILINFLAKSAFAAEFFEVHSNARAMGMGGAYAALVEDDESLWYNPAGLAKNGGIFWKIADPKIGLSDLTSAMEAFSDLSDPLLFESTLNSLYGEPIAANASAKTSFIMPLFAAAYFYDIDASIVVDNPVNPTMTTNYIKDTGVAIGSGWTMGGILQMGFAAKYIQRTGARNTYGTQTIGDIIAGNTTPDVIFDNLEGDTGTGFAFDMGLNLLIPTMVQPTLSFVWKNVGNTSFRAGVGEVAPPTAPSDMTVGASMLIDLPLVHVAPVIEFRHLEDGSQIGKKMHMGVELGLPLLDLRAGLYQGYVAYGFGLGLGLLQIDAAMWKTELGSYPGQYPSQRYMIQLTLDIGFDFGFGTGGLSSGSSSSSASSGGSGSGSKGGSGGGSYFRKKKLKVRR